MSKIIIETTTKKGIPLNEYYLDGYNHKGLVIVQHGFQSNKSRGSDYLSINLARLGYFVVAIDALKHGERKEEPFVSMEDYYRYADAFNVVDKTSDEIIDLFESYYQSTFSKFDMIGVSMGGFIAYVVSQRCNYVSKLLPVITTPDFTKLATTRTNVPGIEEYRKEVKQYLPMIDEMSPHDKFDKLSFDSMYLLSCTEDPVIDYQPTVSYYENHKDINLKLSLYEDGHVVNRKMQVDILEYISNEKVVL